MVQVLVALGAGALIGLSLGTLGAGGSVLAVPVLVHGLGQSPAQATTGSLLVVAVTAALAGAAAHRAGTVHVTRGVLFALLASGGAVLGATWSATLDEDLMMVGFGVLMLVSTVLTFRRQRHSSEHRELPDHPTAILTFRPAFRCACRQALAVVLAATGVGLVTGLLGVGGGFLVVPALTMALGMGLKEAAGTSLVVITLTSTIALTTRLGHGVAPDPGPVLLLTAAASAAALLGVRLAGRLDARRLGMAFTALLAGVGIWVSATALPALL